MRQGRARLWVAFAAALTLAGCDEGKAPFAATKADGAQASGTSPVSVERDVEAPNVFSAKGEGLWDGRPSLGGVWVAHASVVDPERVMIRNPKNGKSVVGALFRRERDNPGPSLQVSSDAAEALGMLAGQPAELTVVALRREEKPVPADADIAGSDAGAEAPVTEAAPAKAAAAGATVADAGTDATAASDAMPAEAAVAEAAPAKKSGGLFGFLRKTPKADAATTAPVAAGAATGTIEQTTLDPVAASAAAALDRAGGVSAAPAPSAAPALAATSSAALKRAYVQIGIFSVEANAKRAADQMKSAGMTATVKADQSQGKTYWRVIVGPAASVAERDALASRVKGIGYPDAYPVSN